MAAGDPVRSSDFDPYDLLVDPPRCHSYDGAGTSIANGGTQAIAFDNEVYDTDGMHSGTTARPITFNTDGTYNIQLGMSITPATYSALTVSLRQDSTTSANGTLIRDFVIADSGGGTLPLPSFDKAFTAGQWLQVYVAQTSGSSRVVSTSAYGTFVIARLVAV